MINISAIFQLYHGKNMFIFNEMMMSSALFQTNILSWIFIVLAYQTTVRRQTCRSTRTHYSDSVNQSLLFLLNAVCLAEKQQTPLSQSLNDNHYATDAVNIPKLYSKISTYLCLLVCLFTWLFVCLFVCLFVSLFLCLFCFAWFSFYNFCYFFQGGGILIVSFFSFKMIRFTYLFHTYLSKIEQKKMTLKITCSYSQLLFFSSDVVFYCCYMIYRYSYFLLQEACRTNETGICILLLY